MPSTTTTLLAGAAASTLGALAGAEAAQARSAFATTVASHHHAARRTLTATGDVIQTPYGSLQADAIVSRNRLVKIKVPVLNRKDPITAFSTPKLIREALRAQGADIHSVSGATWTSSAFSQSLQSAIDKTRLRRRGLPLPLPIPVDLTAPSISGTATVGSQLTASPGTWTRDPSSYLYQWESCAATAANCTAIAGATDISYTVTDADSGHRLEVEVTAFAKLGPGYASSQATGVVPPAAPAAPAASAPPTSVTVPVPTPVPTLIAAPAISGTPAVGHTLTATTGAWTAAPTAYSYQWEQCGPSGASCTPVAGATGTTYAVTATDEGQTLAVRVEAANAGGDGVAYSPASSPVPVLPPAMTTAPEVTGQAQVASTLVVGDGVWSNEPTSFTYQWMRCRISVDDDVVADDDSGPSCTNIAGATGPTYTPVARDVGDTLSVTVTARNAAGATVGTSTSTAAVIAAPTLAPSLTSGPAVSGDAAVGSELVATPGTWTNSPSGYSYQWVSCGPSGGCDAISGATAASYTVQSTDISNSIAVMVTATNGSGSTSALSPASSTVPLPPPVNTAPPSISGMATLGSTLIAEPGVWSNRPTFTYTWERCDTGGSSCTVVGGNGPTYEVTSADLGSAIVVVVTATNSGGVFSVTSSAAVTESGPALTAAPTLTGNAAIASTLTASSGIWTGSPSSYYYQWEDCNAAGTSCTAISGATSTSYTLGAADGNHTIIVEVTAVNSYGSATADSDPTAVVAAAASAATYTGGTYSAPSGDIDVQITVSGTEITAITTPLAPNNDVINNSEAISTLESEAFAAQTANGGKLSASVISGLQAVSGATYTSNGFKSSLNDAVQAAIAAGTY